MFVGKQHVGFFSPLLQLSILPFPAPFLSRVPLLSHLSCFSPLISSHDSENHFLKLSSFMLVISSPGLRTYSRSQQLSSQIPMDQFSCQDVHKCICLSRYFLTFLVGTHHGGHQAHPCFRDEETEAHRRQLTGPGSGHRKTM